MLVVTSDMNLMHLFLTRQFIRLAVIVHFPVTKVTRRLIDLTLMKRCLVRRANQGNQLSVVIVDKSHLNLKSFLSFFVCLLFRLPLPTSIAVSLVSHAADSLRNSAFSIPQGGFTSIVPRFEMNPPSIAKIFAYMITLHRRHRIRHVTNLFHGRT